MRGWFLTSQRIVVLIASSLVSSLSYHDHSNLPSKCTSTPKIHEVTIPSDLNQRISSIVINAGTNNPSVPQIPSIQCFSERIGMIGQNYLKSQETVTAF